MTVTTVQSIKVGQTVFLPLVTVPTDGDLSTLTYTATPTGFLTLEPKVDAEGRPTGTNVTGTQKTAAGAPVSVEADVTGDPGLIQAICQVTVTVPLVTAMVLGPAS